MSKYGIANMDPEVMFMVSDAMRNKYTEVIKNLISISRSSQSNAYLLHKNSLQREVVEVNTYNIINKDKNKIIGHFGSKVPSEEQPRAIPDYMGSFDLICTSNNQMDLRRILEEEARRKDMRR